jgi:hypothetical protein
MTEKPGRLARFPYRSGPTQATTTDDNNSINFNVKNFTSARTYNIDCIINEIEKEGQITRRSIALLNKNIHELIILLKDKKNKDREQKRLGTSLNNIKYDN